MECLAHIARKHRVSGNISCFEEVTAIMSTCPSKYRSTTISAANPGKLIRRVVANGRIPHVCVVGAGMAGLRCAKILSDKGIKTTIFEARDRVGGRVEREGHLIDLGSNWIHGTKENPILHLASETNSVCFEPPEDSRPSFYDQSGNEIDHDTALEHSKLSWDIVTEAIKYSQKNGASIPPEHSLIDYYKKVLEKGGLSESSKELVLNMARMWGNIVGEPIERQSLRFMWLEECIEGENLFLASTYKAVLDRVSHEGLAKADLRLNTKVTSIKSRHSADSSPQSINVTTADGKNHSFDEVVMTTPLGWLKRNLSAFTPPLPPQISDPIKHIAYGRLEKVYINFPTPFWHPHDPLEKKPFFIQFLSPNYSQDQNPYHWNLECVSFARLPPPCDHATLLFYLNGPTSEYVTSLVRDTPRDSQKHYDKLDAFFSPYYSLLPDYHPDTCKPLSYVSTDWQNDEFAGCGSYTTFQKSSYEKDGLVELDKDIESLRVGCPERNLWFAGEHTAPFVALGTTTGAYWSGELVAERIVNLYGVDAEAHNQGAPVANGYDEAEGARPVEG
ncbi:MAG: hypothetical protein Q9163_003637 [Psora crenata]